MRSTADEGTCDGGLDKKTQVPSGFCGHVLVTTESTPPKLEHRFYTRGVGPVLAIILSGGPSREELISFSTDLSLVILAAQVTDRRPPGR